jgi:hypothetical protein
MAPPRPTSAQTALLAIPALATVAALAGVLAFLVWTSTRGLDITDEGYYFLGAAYPEDVTISVTASHHLLAPLFRLVGRNIPAYRVTEFVFTVLSAFVLAMGLDACRRRLDPGAPRSWTYLAAEAAAIGAGSLLACSWLLNTPSYNWITNWGLSIAAGCALCALARGRDRGASMCLGALGLTLGVVFLAKFTAAASEGALFAVVLLAWPLAPFRVRVRWLLTAGGGFALALALYFVLVQPPAAWLQMVRRGLWDWMTQTPLHSTSALGRYAVEWRDDVVRPWLGEFAWPFAALTALALAIRFAPERRRPGGRTLHLWAWAVVAYAAYLTAIHLRDYPPSLYPGDIVRLFFGWLLLLGPISIALAWGAWRARVGQRAEGLEGQRAKGLGARFAWTLVVFMLFALPFAGAAGTANPLHFGMRYTIGPWFALFALALGALSAPARVLWTVPVGFVCLTAICAVYVVRGAVEAPYRLRGGLRAQTEDTPIGPTGVTLKLDPALHDFITGVRRTADASGFKPGDDLLGFFDMPGIVYALGARSPGQMWYTLAYPGSRIAMERALLLADRERLRRAYILQTASSTSWITSLAATGIRFPDDYVLCGTFTIPYSWADEEVKWWRPKAR